MIEGGKSKYVSLLALIKDERRPLYELINDLCLDHTFRTQKFKNTFLLPSKELVGKLQKLVQDDKDIEAIDIIRSLLLKGHLDVKDFIGSAEIGTLQYTPSILADPVSVKSKIAKSKKSIITTREGSNATVVFEYDDSEPPKTKAGKSGGLVLVGTKSGGADDSRCKMVKDLTNSMVVEGDAVKTVDNFFKGVSALLVKLESDEKSFDRAKYYLAANPILSWFFLTMPNATNPLVKEAHLKDCDWSKVVDCKIITKAEESADYKTNTSMMKAIKDKRSRLVSGDRGSLVKDIKSVYMDLCKEAPKYNSIDDNLCNNVHLKMLMDELRFMYENAVSTWDQVDDAIKHLGSIAWCHPEKHLTICDEGLYRNLKLCPESFVSGPVKFVRSIYLFYVPLSEAIENQLTGTHGGSIEGGNPAEIRSVVFTGGAARKQMKKNSADGNLAIMVSMLSKQQKEALKGML